MGSLTLGFGHLAKSNLIILPQNHLLSIHVFYVLLFGAFFVIFFNSSVPYLDRLKYYLISFHSGILSYLIS